VTCLDDGALARLATSATAIAPAARSGWLQDLADRLERSERAPTAGARHMRAWRARARSGRCLFEARNGRS
jgi:hypothetical protein